MAPGEGEAFVQVVHFRVEIFSYVRSDGPDRQVQMIGVYLLHLLGHYFPFGEAQNQRLQGQNKQQEEEDAFSRIRPL